MAHVKVNRFRKPMLTLRTLGDDLVCHSEVSDGETLREKAITVVKRSEL